MAQAMAKAVEAGRLAARAGRIPMRRHARASSPTQRRTDSAGVPTLAHGAGLVESGDQDPRERGELDARQVRWHDRRGGSPGKRGQSRPCRRVRCAGWCDQRCSSQRVKDALHGVWLGHPLHPPLTDLPIGAWTAAGLLDAMPGTGNAAADADRRRLRGLRPDHPRRLGGLVRPARAAATGRPGPRRGGRDAPSPVTPRRSPRGRRARRRAARRGPTPAWRSSASPGYLGGHLAFRQAAGVNHVESVPHLFPEGWHDIGRLDDFDDGELSQPQRRRRRAARRTPRPARRRTRQHLLAPRRAAVRGQLHRQGRSGLRRLPVARLDVPARRRRRRPRPGHRTDAACSRPGIVDGNDRGHAPRRRMTASRPFTTSTTGSPDTARRTLSTTRGDQPALSLAGRAASVR